MKLQLIQVGIETTPDRGLRGWLQPLGLLYIATFVKANFPEAEVEILDGNLISNEEILDKIDADVVGFTTVMRNYENTLKIAYNAKERGSEVILGGPHATFFAKIILKNRDYIDAVIIYDGERALFDYVIGKNKKEIKNIVFRNACDNRIIVNETGFENIDSIPYPNRNLVKVGNYITNFRLDTNSPFNAGINIISQRGCLWKARSSGCIFCGIPNTNVRFRTPNNIWEEIILLNHDFNIDFFFDVSPNIAFSKKWLKALLNNKPAKLNNIGFRFYISAECIDHENIDTLTRLGCCQIFVGFESFVDRQLKSINKRASLSNNLQALNLLKASKLCFIPSFIIGAPGEDINSARKTFKYAYELSQLSNCDDIHWSLFKPIPGSHSFNQLLNDEVLKEKYANKDIFSEHELIVDWMKHKCNLPDEIIDDLVINYDKIKPRREILYKPPKLN